MEAEAQAGMPRTGPNTVWKHLGMTHLSTNRKAVCPRCRTPYETAPTTPITCDNGLACGATVQVGA